MAARSPTCAPTPSGGSRAGATSAPSSGRRRLAATLLRAKAAALFRHLPGALAGDEESVHQVRVGARRLRVAIRLLVDKPTGKRARRAQALLARMTRTAGAARDLDVLLDAFTRRLRQAGTRTAEQDRLRRRLASLRRRGRARMVSSLLDLPIAELRADLARLTERAGADLPRIHERFHATCAKASRRLLDGFVALGAHLDLAALHALRRRARRLRYAVEIFLQARGDDSSPTKPWRDLQDRIGALHDQHLLAEWLDRQAVADAKRGQPNVAAAATAEATWARRTMQRLHDELLAADPAGLARRGVDAVGLPPPPSTR
jgi:CHAD domain-containing protein